MKEKEVSINDQFSLFVSNSLEEYRCETFLTKEPETVAWINNCFCDGNIIYDIGANIGIYALYAGAIYPNARVYAFEPYYKNYERLCTNARLNKLQNVTSLYMALAEHTCIDQLYVKDDRISSSGHQVGQDVDERGNTFDVLDQYPVLVFSVDEAIQIFSLPVPNHIKIDVDGAEEKILKGMKKTLADPVVKSVLVEVNSNVSEKTQILQYFENEGFSTDNEFNKRSDHSRYRRKGTISEYAENIIFVRKS